VKFEEPTKGQPRDWCKEGCILDISPGHAHRVPIDCVTVDDLWNSIDARKKDIERLEKENMRLKAEVYDLQQEPEY
jgi:hypothetical protein